MATEVVLVDVRATEPAQRSVSANPAAVYLAGLRPSGRRSMAARLDAVAEMLGFSGWRDCPWAELRYEHVLAIRSKLAERYAPASVNATLAALRGVSRAAWRMGLIDAEAYQRVADVRPMAGRREPAGRGLTAGEIAALMRACAADTTPVGARDAAIIALAYGCGLRRAEIVALDVAALAHDGQGFTLRVMGKGGKERLAYLGNGSAEAIRDWLAVRGDAPGPLFYAGRRGGHLAKRRLSAQAVMAIVARRAEQAQVAHCSPHDLRRSFVSDLLDSGVDIALVARLAGHANMATTQRYDRRPDTAAKRAATALHVPYAKRRGL